MKKFTYIVFLSLLIAASSGCKKEITDGKNSLVDFIVEPRGANCQSGGFLVNSGIDSNGNNVLDESEIVEAKYICNGNDGDNSLISYIPESAGENCEAGGFKIISGLDADGNNFLSDEEISSIEYLCNGENGNMNSDKLVRLVISAYNLSTTSTEWYLSPYPTYNFPDFNKTDYQGVDSILFVPSMNTSDPANKCIVELFNITDNVPIANTLIESNLPGWNFHYSRNIYDYLPDKKIDLGIRIRCEKEGYGASTGIVSYLYIYKH